ncbi:kunitz-type serine protease inhibitor bitisilin-2-like [Drosophila ficusphila]|uniref:kunitz-type serine protease inhibitor bitisilin-2-like n=1 Tax=Drosophila ficusphila TaxID=30025 RepID=UPI0007E5C934|nr:kunitz-type serine protease inhibitor bitisilin-2-like [Drosophila ficusphila]
MCYRYSFSFALIALLLLAAGVFGAPSDVLVEKAEDPSVPKPQPDGDLKVPEVCHQPIIVGHCHALIYRFAYNVDTQSCEVFTYGGCGGNKNNFDTKDLCEQACLGKSGVAESTPEQINELSNESSMSD